MHFIALPKSITGPGLNRAKKLGKGGDNPFLSSSTGSRKEKKY
jgi:hypothetical protein